LRGLFRLNRGDDESSLVYIGSEVKRLEHVSHNRM
jgi:hypothetical protein